MKNQILCALVLGAVAAMPVFTACNRAELEDLQTRVTVLEGKIAELKSDLQNAMVTGATILTATQDAGVWTLTLSDGKVITITPSTGGGSAITVEETADAFVITVDGTTYAIPKSSGANSLVFVDEYGDGKVILGNDGASFALLATPAIDAAAAEFSIADAREVLTRAGADLFKVEGATNDGDLIRLTIKGLAAESGKLYTVAVKAVVNGVAISSNYFTVQVGDEFSFEREALEDVEFAEGVQATQVSTGVYYANLPEESADFLGSFNFNSLYKQNMGANFELAPREEQNGKVQERFDFFQSCLSADGTWTMQGRPGTNCFDPDPEKDGLVVYCVVNDQVKNKVRWIIEDPIRTGLANYGRDDDATWGDIHYAPFPESQHVEYRKMVPAGAAKYNFINIIMQSTPGEENDFLWFQHGDAPQSIAAVQQLEITAREQGDILYSDGETLALGELGEKLARHSQGIWWQSTQPSVVSSQRDNLTDEQKQAVKDAYGTECNGEIISGWDGNAWDAHEQLGYDWDGQNFVTTAAYTGTAFRFGLGLRFEYDYGQIRIGGWHTFYMFFNRRLAPEGAVDPMPR